MKILVTGGTGFIDSHCKEIHNKGKLGEQKRSCLDCSKIKRELGWQSKYDLDKGLKETIKYFLEK